MNGEREFSTITQHTDQAPPPVSPLFQRMGIFCFGWVFWQASVELYSGGCL
jgi:hypothetical protein